MKLMIMTTLSCLLACVNLITADVRVISVNLQENARRHHTDRYKLSSQELIVRRGGHISMGLGKKSSLGQLSAKITLSHRELDRFRVGDSRPGHDPKSYWSCTIDEKETERSGDFLKILIHVPVKAAVGRYAIKFFEDGEEEEQTFEQSAYVLFNPWNSGESV